MTKILKISGLNYTVAGSGIINSEEFTILYNISFEVDKNEIIGITGESGSGKTTLAKLIAGIIQPTAGSLKFNFSRNGNNSKQNPVQILFQNNNEILNPYRTIDSIVKEALLIRNKNEDPSKEKDRIFCQVGLNNNLQKRKGFELSGGEQQRAALARILAARPELLILDEPFSAQDVESQVNFIDLFKKIKSEFNLTMICVAHNLKILRKLTDRIIVMYKGEIVEIGNTGDLFNSPKHDYTKFLLNCENYNLKYDELRFAKSHN